MDQIELEFILERLDITKENVKHILLSDGSEMIGEIIPNNEPSNINDNGVQYTKDPFTYIINPLKILRDTYIDDDKVINKEYYVEWNTSLETPIIPINPSLIVSITSVNVHTLYHYLKNVNHVYYVVPTETTEVVDILKEKSINEDNIIDFLSYRSKRLSGSFK